MDKNTTTLHSGNESQKMGWGVCVCVCVCALLISEITGSVLGYPVPHKICHAYVFQLPPIF